MIKFEITGSSHGDFVGIKATGLPKGFTFDPVGLADFMEERAPGRSPWTSKRKEDDIITFVSGVDHSELTGDILEIRIYNNDVRKSDYDTDIIRPGTSDYTAKLKYGAHYNETGSGRFSGRMTAPMCALGGIVLQILEDEGITVDCSIKSIGKSENAEDFEKIIQAAAEDGDSVGGVVLCKISGMPGGLGGPLSEGIECKISEKMFMIPGVTGIEFGGGFNSAKLRGSENNDEPYFENGKIKFKSNNQGGLQGGITNGMPIEFSVSMKPTPSISKKQNTINFRTGENTTLEIKGRHDPCIVLRARPVVRALAAITVYDIVRSEKTSETLSDFREEIDSIDDEITTLLMKRADISKKIGEIKMKSGTYVTNSNREQELVERAIFKADGDYEKEKIIRDFYGVTFENSKSIQEKLKSGRFGLLGKTLGYSLSPKIHRLLGNYNYDLFEVPECRLREFVTEKSFNGLNVTAPYKEVIVPLVDEIFGEARYTGTINTIVNREGKLCGYNTDCFGFDTLLETSGINVKDKVCLVLGNGGASKAVKHVLCEKGAKDVRILKRNETPEYDEEIIINATPVGTYPDSEGIIVTPKMFKKCESCIDLVYNPLKTRFLREAKLCGIKAVNGLMMLVAQAVYSSSIWQDKPMDKLSMVKKSYEIYAKIITDCNIALIGMPGSGKTTVGREMAARFGKTFVDTDDEIQKITGKKAADIISESGEAAFRRIETEVLRDVMKRENIVVATGGGVVTREENYGILAENAVICLLDTPVSMLAKGGRPLTEKNGNEKLYEERKDAYEKWADVRFRL